MTGRLSLEPAVWVGERSARASQAPSGGDRRLHGRNPTPRHESEMRPAVPVAEHPLRHKSLTMILTQMILSNRRIDGLCPLAPTARHPAIRRSEEALRPAETRVSPFPFGRRRMGRMMSGCRKLLLFALAIGLQAAGRAESPASEGVFVRFRLKEPSDAPWFVRLGGYIHNEPWYLPAAVWPAGADRDASKRLPGALMG